tara:strand:+ start:218 stop:442 length:225 start_codon:yes stop_codon:yes gene_type:complete
VGFFVRPLNKELVGFVFGLSFRSNPTFTDSSQESGSKYCIPVSNWYSEGAFESILPPFCVAISFRFVKNKIEKT